MSRAAFAAILFVIKTANRNTEEVPMFYLIKLIGEVFTLAVFFSAPVDRRRPGRSPGSSCRY